jgi:hypothetical protein
MQRARLAAAGIHLLARAHVIGEFHDVVEVSGALVLAHVEDLHQPGVGARNRLELPDALEFPIEGA